MGPPPKTDYHKRQKNVLSMALRDELKAVLGALEADPRVKAVVLTGGSEVLRVGMPQALRLSLSGEPLSAQEARAVGLVDSVVPAAELLPAARAEAEGSIACHSLGRRLGLTSQVDQPTGTGQPRRTQRKEAEHGCIRVRTT